MKYLRINLLLLLLLLLPVQVGLAQDSQPVGPIYIVQSGDTLWDISQRFNVTLTDLMNLNNISDGSTLKAGDRLVIPGLEGITGVLDTRPVYLGDTLRSLSRQYRVAEDSLLRLNHLVSPLELYAGANLIIPQQENRQLLGSRISLSLGQSVLEKAVLQGENPWRMLLLNRMAKNWQAIPGDVLHLPGEAAAGLGAFPAVIQSAEITPLPLVQGKTTVLQITAAAGAVFEGAIAGRIFSFHEQSAGDYVGMQGVYAMLPAGLYPLSIRGSLADGTPVGFTQLVPVQAGSYAYENLVVDAATIDPVVTKPEDAQWTALVATATDEKLWSGGFTSPVAPEYTDCWPSVFGNRRSYNQSEYLYFHTGLDFCGQVGHLIYAPAAGEVVFVGPLTVRGNATMINHGWGIYSGFMHQSEIQVSVGDRVEAGQQIGLIGSTGRVTGPHLHWEVWVGGVQVDPMDWLQNAYP